ncbi:MAG: hypothetical protein MUF42_14225 [Cytophagaceae bacterium]|jgi:hypothetical protein|nr:hypothetical protein [Cytophagaceae bacterium]
MRLTSDFFDIKNSSYSEIGSWTFSKGVSESDINSKFIFEFLKSIELCFDWINFSKINIYSNDNGEAEFNYWNFDGIIPLSDFVLGMNIKPHEEHNEILNCNFKLSCIIDEQNVFINDSGYFLIIYDFEQKNIVIIFTVYVNIFSDCIWWFDQLKREKVELSIGEENSSFNRKKLMESIKKFVIENNLKVDDFESEAMTDIYEFGFNDGTKQYRL